MRLNEIFGKRAKQWFMRKTNNPFQVRDLTKGSKEDHRGPLKDDARHLQQSPDAIESKSSWMQMRATHGHISEEEKDDILRLRRQFAKGAYEERWMDAASTFREFQDLRDKYPAQQNLSWLNRDIY